MATASPWPRRWTWLILVAALVLRLWYAHGEPHSGRFFDERIAFANIESILDSASLRPENYWYQSLSYWPQAALLAASEQLASATGWDALRVRDAHGFRPLAYHLCRGTMALFGTLSLWLTFVIGRRVFSPWVGCLGALLLAVTPWHLITSARFKPDAPLLFVTLLTFWWILAVVEEPSLGNYLRAGLGVGWTLATKLNGVMVVIPLCVFTVTILRRRPKVLLYASAAGFTALAVYLVTNPWLRDTLWALRQNRDIYARQAEAVGSNHFEVLQRSATSLFSPMFHGPVLASLVFAGAALWMARALLHGDSHPGRRPWTKLLPWIFLSFPVGQSLLFAAMTERFKENHHVQVLPFTSLLAAFFMVEALRWLLRRGGRAWVAVPCVAALIVISASIVRIGRFVYDEVVPSTARAAQATLAQEQPSIAWRQLCHDGAIGSDPATALRRLGWAISHIDDLSNSADDRLQLCDTLLVAAEGQHHRVFPPDRERHPVRPQWFRRRGPELIRVSAGWQPEGVAVPVVVERADSTVTGTLFPCPSPDHFQTFEISVPVPRLVDLQPLSARVSDGEGPSVSLHWLWIRKQARRHLFVSRRIPCSPEFRSLRLSTGSPWPTDKSLDIHQRFWRRPAHAVAVD